MSLVVQVTVVLEKACRSYLELLLVFNSEVCVYDAHYTCTCVYEERLIATSQKLIVESSDPILLI